MEQMKKILEKKKAKQTYFVHKNKQSNKILHLNESKEEKP